MIFTGEFCGILLSDYPWGLNFITAETRGSKAAEIPRKVGLCEISPSETLTKGNFCSDLETVFFHIM